MNSFQSRTTSGLGRVRFSRSVDIENMEIPKAKRQNVKSKSGGCSPRMTLTVEIPGARKLDTIVALIGRFLFMLNRKDSATTVQNIWNGNARLWKPFLITFSTTEEPWLHFCHYPHIRKKVALCRRKKYSLSSCQLCSMMNIRVIPSVILPLSTPAE